MNGIELAAKREKCGITQGQLAEYLGISRTSIWRLEGSEEEVGRTIDAIAETLEPGNHRFTSWVDRKADSDQILIRRRQHKWNLKVSMGKP
jgi:transcriptional regulator with XRE-family HTH domain